MDLKEGWADAAAVRSIVDLVEEVVIVDNRSDDATPRIIEALCRRYPEVRRASVWRSDQLLRKGVIRKQKMGLYPR